MDITIVIAIIAGLSTAIPSILATVSTSKVREKIQEEHLKQMSEKIDTLSEKVERHNHFETRIVALETSINAIKEKLK